MEHRSGRGLPKRILGLHFGQRRSVKTGWPFTCGSIWPQRGGTRFLIVSDQNGRHQPEPHSVHKNAEPFFVETPSAADSVDSDWKDVRDEAHSEPLRVAIKVDEQQFGPHTLSHSTSDALIMSIRSLSLSLSISLHCHNALRSPFLMIGF